MLRCEPRLNKNDDVGTVVPVQRDLDEIAARLRLLRLAHGYDAFTAWGRFVGISNTAWHNYESAARRISIDEAIKLCAKTGVSLDWIYRGDAYWHTLPGHLQQKLTAARQQPERPNRPA